ncbi:MAG: ATP-binding cassette domain-containing protein [Lachnospiraceae bacterium]
MLEVKELTVRGKDNFLLLKDISLKLSSDSCLGLTGASGSGKTSLLKAIMGLLDSDCRIEAGDILLAGKSLFDYPEKERRRLCGTTFGFIPQNPMVSFSKHRKIKTHLIETFKYHLDISKEELVDLSRAVLEKVNLDAERMLELYPEQLSGGMLQRVAIAISLGLNTEYIFADEPTSALDEYNKKIVIELFKDNYKDAGILFLSHDVEALEALCTDIAVLSCGSIMEKGASEQVLRYPQTQWTKSLMAVKNEKNRKGWTWKKLK